MPQYRDYLRKPPSGYDYFFTQRYGPNPQNLWQGKHAIDISYGFKRASDVSQLFPHVEKKPLVHVEDHQDLERIRMMAERHGLDPAAFRSAHGTSCIDYLRSLAESRVFFAPSSSRPLGGLANLDSVAADCVVLANRRDLWNPGFGSSAASCTIEALREFMTESEPALFQATLLEQQARLFTLQQARVSRQLN